jgi:Trypsin Inhibitor like cysteine rich domain
MITLCHNTCEETCADVLAGVTYTGPCTTDCVAGCDCLTGFVRDAIGDCIDRTMCSKCCVSSQLNLKEYYIIL